ncbi:prolyl oligopeptidase family serine peptidase [Halanaerocella petrolearia]
MLDKGSMLIFIILLLSLLVVSGCKVDQLSSSDVTLITKVLPYGEVGYAIALDLGTKISGLKLPKDAFKVETIVNGEFKERTITKIYSNDSPSIAEKSKSGRYLIIELDPKDKNATTFKFNAEKFQNIRKNLKYYISLSRDIKTEDGIVFETSEEKIVHSKEITPVVDNFKRSVYKDSKGNKLKYRFFEPKIKSNKEYPLILFLHGSGERGNDNSMQLLGNEGAVVWARPEQQEKSPAYILAPQVPIKGELSYYWTEEPTYSMVIKLLKETINNYSIDTDRIYVVGMSNGGIGTWHIIEENPDLFAAAVPICGIPDISNNSINQDYQPLSDNSRLKLIKNIPIWVFHSEDDPLVDVRYSRDGVAAIRSLGGTSIKYTEYESGTVKPSGHFAWVPALQNQKMIDWLFKQSK